MGWERRGHAKISTRLLELVVGDAGDAERGRGGLADEVADYGHHTDATVHHLGLTETLSTKNESCNQRKTWGWGVRMV